MTDSVLAGQPRQTLGSLVVLASLSEVAYAAVVLSGQSLHEEGAAGYSLLGILALFVLAFACYLAAIRAALRVRQDGRLLVLIIGAAVLFRVTLLASDPIEEIDLYRYLWDGAVLNEGISPFRYSPAQVLAAAAGADLPVDLGRLAALRDRSPEMRAILERIHFGELATIYPPISQLVFALATLTTPADASLPLRMTVMKGWFVGFDLATLGLVLALLRFTGRPIGWSVVYGWCPLVLKEVANSGHLDALTVFLATLSVYLAVLSLFPSAAGGAYASARGCQAMSLATAAGFVLALAAGAKLYPVILAPLLIFGVMRRHGWRSTVAPVIVFGLSTALVLWPMLPGTKDATAAGTGQVAAKAEELPPLPPMESFSEPPAPEPGLSAFASEWEMNDFLFLILMENLRPYAALPPHERAWFSVVPERWRSAIVDGVSSRLGIAPWRVPFFLSRASTSAAFAAIALVLAWRASHAAEPAEWLRAAFLTLAWFWLLLPTLNPWYWTWVLPLLPFARNRAWLAVSGLVFLYYLRFWLTYHFAESPMLGTRYPGPWFFDYIVTWLEFGPWFIWLGLGKALRASRQLAPAGIGRL